jgi:transcriptional regulator with GAF, ATPase, and Fis domain
LNDSEALRASIDALSRFFIGANTLEHTLQRVVELAHEAVPQADMIGITMLDEHGKPATTVFTDGEAPEIDRAQYDSGSGPCLDAFRNNEMNRIRSMDIAPRWPAFVAACIDHGIASTLSMPLVARDQSIGALNLYSRTPDAFDLEAERVSGSFAEHAAVPLANAHAYWITFRLSKNLNDAMASRAVIEQAKGIIMAQENVDAEEAFETLTKLSQRINRKVRDLAQGIVDNRYFRHD